MLPSSLVIVMPVELSVNFFLYSFSIFLLFISLPFIALLLISKVTLPASHTLYTANSAAPAATHQAAGLVASQAAVAATCFHVAIAIAFICAIHFGIVPAIWDSCATAMPSVIASSCSCALVRIFSVTARCSFAAVSLTVCASSPSMTAESCMDAIASPAFAFASASDICLDNIFVMLFCISILFKVCLDLRSPASAIA